MNKRTLPKQLPSEADLPVPACPQAVQAAAWAVGALDPVAQRAYRAHLSHCPCCTAELASCQRTVARLRATRMADAEPSPDLTDRIMAALPPAAFGITPFTRVRAFVRRHRYQLAAAAAVLLASVLGTWQLLLPRTVDTGSATLAGCAWIAGHQEADGSWDPARVGGQALYRPALTALATLALTREPERYPQEIAAACRALVREQQSDGAFGPDDSARMYNHALSTWALLAACDTGRHPELRGVLERAVAFIRARQQTTGGWGYSSSVGEPANTAVTAWQVQVLARAQQAGWDDAGGNLRKGLNWLRQRADNHGQFGYTAAPGSASATPTLNAMGAYTLLTAGGSRPELVQTAAAAIAHLRTAARTEPAHPADLYRSFFTAAAWDAAGDHGRADRVRADVCGQRELGGADKGSWVPSDGWGKVGGRLYATSVAVLTLQPRAEGTL